MDTVIIRMSASGTAKECLTVKASRESPDNSKARIIEREKKKRKKERKLEEIYFPKCP